METKKKFPATLGDSEVLAVLGADQVAPVIAVVPIEKDGTELFTVGNPGQVSGSVSAANDWTVDTVADEAADDSDKVVYTVPVSTETQVLWLWVELISTADAGDRQVVVEILDSDDDVIAQFRAGAVQAASLTRYYMFGSSLADLDAFRDTNWLMTPIVPGLILKAGDQVHVYDNNAVAAGADDMVVQMQVATRSV